MLWKKKNILPNILTTTCEDLSILYPALIRSVVAFVDQQKQNLIDSSCTEGRIVH